MKYSGRKKNKIIGENEEIELKWKAIQSACNKIKFEETMRQVFDRKKEREKRM